MNIALIPSSKSLLNNRRFEINYLRDKISEPSIELRNELLNTGHKYNTYDLYTCLSDIEIIIVYRFEFNMQIILNIIRANPKVQIITVVSEEQNIAPLHNKEVLDSNNFDAVLTWRDDMINSER